MWLFLLVAFGISWGAFLIRRAAEWPLAVDQTLRMTVKFGPSVAGILAACWVRGLGGVSEILRCLVTVRVNVAWFALALLLPILVVSVALPIRYLLGNDILAPRGLDLADAVGLYVTLLAVRLFAGGGLGEELGWRGFMLPQLQPRLGALNASVVIGLFHGAWHLPAYGFGAVILTVFTVSGAVIFTWMYNRTDGNLLLPALMHASANASLPWLETVLPAIDGELLFPLIVFGIWAALAVILVWRVGARNLGPRAP